MRYFFTWYQLSRNSWKINVRSTQGFKRPGWPSIETKIVRKDSDTAIKAKKYHYWYATERSLRQV
jgi:hypothetical protein